MATLSFEPVDNNIAEMHRARVPGGWLVMVREAMLHYWPDGGIQGWIVHPALTFLPLSAWPEDEPQPQPESAGSEG